MIKYIDHYWAEGGVIEFNTDSGSVKSDLKYEWLNAPDWGYAWKQKERWFVLHNDDSSFILQAGSESWRLSPDLNLSLRRLFMFRQFRIIKDSKLIFSLWYVPRYFYMPLLDPAHDADEEEGDDFFLFLTNFWDSWKSREYAEFLKVMEENREM